MGRLRAHTRPTFSSSLEIRILALVVSLFLTAQYSTSSTIMDISHSLGWAATDGVQAIEHQVSLVDAEYTQVS